MEEHANMNIKIVKDFKEDCTDVDMDSALKTANKFQKRMIIPKFFFIAVAIWAVMVIFQEKITGETSLDSERNNIIFLCIFFPGMIISILTIIIGGICPYCHNFQKQNGKVKGVSDSSVFYAKGASPFIHYCTRCGAPLSKKAVKAYYENKESQNPTIDTARKED